MEIMNREHPAYEPRPEDLEITTEREMEKAKKEAGVTTEEEAKERIRILRMKESIERIKRELDLDIEPKINKDGWVEFKKAKENLDQISKLLTCKDNGITSVSFANSKLGPEDIEVIANVLKDTDNEIKDLSLSVNKFGLEGARHIAGALKNSNNKVENLYLGLNFRGDKDEIYGERCITKTIRNENNKLKTINFGNGFRLVL